MDFYQFLNHENVRRIVMKYILGLITLGVILFKVYEYFKYKQDEIDTTEDI